MKKILSYQLSTSIAILFFLSSLFSCSHAQSFTLTGNILGVEQGKLVLKNIENKPDASDSVVISINKGQFKYTSQTIQKGLYIADIRIGEKSIMIPHLIYVEKGKLTLNGDVSKEPISIITKGTPLNDEFDKFRKSGLDSLEGILQANFKKLQMSTNEAENKVIKEQVMEVLGQRTKLMTDYITTHPKSMVSLGNCIMLIGNTDPAQVINLFQGLDTSVKNSSLGKQLAQNFSGAENAAKGVDKMAIDFTLPSPDGQQVSLSSFKGQYVLIDFWASWCPPCRRENPHVVKVYQKYHSKGFEILGVSFDSDKAKWVEAIKKDQLTWPQVSELKGWESKVGELYNVTAIPANFLVDPSGKIIAQDLRGDNLEKKLSEIFP